MGGLPEIIDFFWRGTPQKPVLLIEGMNQDEFRVFLATAERDHRESHMWARRAQEARAEANAAHRTIVANSGKGLTFSFFQRINAERCEAGQLVDGKPVGGFAKKVTAWSEERWLTAALGELGELANLVKKHFRGFDLTKGQTLDEVQAAYGDEWADTVCYLFLFASRVGIDAEQALTRKWNEVSVRVKSPLGLTIDTPMTNDSLFSTEDMHAAMQEYGERTGVRKTNYVGSDLQALQNDIIFDLLKKRHA